MVRRGRSLADSAMSRPRRHIDVRRRSCAAARALDRHEARTEAVEAGKVLVAGGQVDLALAAERRLLRLHAETVGFDRAVAAALADEVVDVGEFWRIGQPAALAPPPLFGGAFLRVDQHGDTRNVAQLALDGVEIARADGRSRRRESRACRTYRHRRTPARCADAVGADLLRDAMDADRPVDRLATGHGDRIVEEDLVGDVGPAAIAWRIAIEPE